MEDIAFSDWPGQPVDIAGSNTWMPAYGFQAPTTLLDKEDFLGHPDAELFLHGTAGQSYVYLETIQEETSDDLRSDSDLSESRDSPVGWLATDSESGSVIRIHTLGQIECSSERELACPSKRRKQENLSNLSDDELESLSRSSSLIQFESLEKQCQDISNSSPSIFSNFSYEDHQHPNSDNEPESDYYRSLKIDGIRKRKSRDSLFYNSGRFSGSDSSDTTESEDTLDTAKYGSCKSVNNLKTWRSYDGLHSTGKANKISAENLSEDSGYGDQLYQTNKNKSSSIPNIAMLMRNDKLERKTGRYLEQYRLKNFQNVPNNFTAYDGEGFQNFTGNFGVSYQDLSILDKYEKPNKKDRLLRNVLHHKSLNKTEFESNFNSQTGSEPNLLVSSSTNVQSSRHYSLLNFKDNVLVSSVPKDLNLTSNITTWSTIETTSIATKNFDLSNIQKMERKKYKKRHQQQGDTIFISLKKGSSTESEPEPHYKREGSYLEAMENMINMSDDESKPKTKRNTILEFDKNILKAISEQSLQGSAISLGDPEKILFLGLSTDQNRNVKSTPNLTVIQHDEEVVKRNSMLEMPRKSSLVNKSSTSSENEDKTLTSTKSFSGSSSSKGVHFCPVVSEVNWRDGSSSTERGSSYSLSSTPEVPEEPVTIIKPQPRRVYASEPELEMVQVGEPEVVKLSDMEYTFVPLRPRNSISQPNVNLKRHSTSGVENQVRLDDSDGVGVYKPTPTTSHVPAEPAQEVKAPVIAMESNAPARRTKNKKLSGFFSRIASFRFTKKNDDKKDQKPKKKIDNIENQTGERLATKSDYIYIPLKGPLSTPNQPTNNNDLNKCISGKPPLPKLPPKIVGACVKRSREAAAPKPPLDRDCIDSGCTTPMEPMGLLETDLDTEVTVITSGAHVKTRSLMNLGADAPPASLAAPEHPCRPHKSMEYLLDKQNLKVVEPPENELQKGERVMSEHQLRVQRSLQKLTVPDWYKNSEVPREGFLLKKSPCRETRWTGTSSKTTSLSSLGSSNQSPVILSPTPQNQPFVRWSTSKLNSTASSPCASTRSSFNTRQPNGSISPSSLRSSFNYRQPYLGWRSQERLNRPRTPAERLANTLLNQNQQSEAQESPEIQSSIKEVTSAIVHYVSGLKPEDTGNREHSYDSQETASQRSRSVSPRGSQKLCWLESSFVGTRPLDSPETPVTLEGQNSTPVPPSSLRLQLHAHNEQEEQENLPLTEQ